MKKLGLLAALTCVGMFGANTSHDAPLEVESRSVHVFFRADTLIDPGKAQAIGANASQLLQHTHALDHKLRVFVGHRAPSDLTIKPTDELHFRLAGKRRFFGLFPGPFRGYMTVKPVVKPGAGKLVAGHAAKLRETSARCAEPTGKGFDECVEAALPASERDSLDLVWVVQAPTGFSWVPTAAFGLQKISAAINDAAKAPNHDHARKNAPRIEFELKGGAEVFVDRFFVVGPGKAPKGHGIELHRGSRVLVCENYDASGAGNPIPVCPAP